MGIVKTQSLYKSSLAPVCCRTTAENSQTQDSWPKVSSFSIPTRLHVSHQEKVLIQRETAHTANPANKGRWWLQGLNRVRNSHFFPATTSTSPSSSYCSVTCCLNWRYDSCEKLDVWAENVTRLTRRSDRELEMSGYGKQVCVSLSDSGVWCGRRDMNEAPAARGITSRELTSDLPMTNLRHV